jgi:hypothetical protein
MSIESAVHALLASVPKVAGGRVFPLIAKSNTSFPYVTYLKVSGERYSELSGPINHARPRMRFNVFAETYAEAKSVTTAIRQKLDGYNGTIEGISILASTLENEVDSYENDIKIYQVTTDYFISHTE